jgi:DNA repair exonuclease SbcCD ATPase subunit
VPQGQTAPTEKESEANVGSENGWRKRAKPPRKISGGSGASGLSQMAALEKPVVTDRSATSLSSSSTKKATLHAKVSARRVVEGESTAEIKPFVAKLRVRPGELEKFLDNVYYRARAAGHSPSQIVAKALEAAELEQNFGQKYSKLKLDYERTAKQLEIRKRDLEKVEEEIEYLKRARSKKFAENSVEEKNLESFLKTRAQLSSLGVEIDSLGGFEDCLVALSKEGFKPRKIIQDLNEIRDLQAQRASLRQELIKAREELDRLSSSAQARKKEFDLEIKEQKEKVEQLEKRYADKMREIVAYSELRALGIDGKRILAWNDLMTRANLDAASVEAELSRQGSLKKLEEDRARKIAELESREQNLKDAVASLEQKRESIFNAIDEIKTGALGKIEQAGLKMSLTMSELGEKTKATISQTAIGSEASLADTAKTCRENLIAVSEDAKKNFSSTITEMNSQVTSFTKELGELLSQLQPQIKTVSQAFDAGEKIGRYKTILPLLDLMEDARGKESEALIAMWNVSSRFNMWLTERYRGKKREISEPLEALISAVNEEIQNASDRSENDSE